MFGAIYKRAYQIVEALVPYSVIIVVVVNTNTDRYKYAVNKQNDAQPVTGNDTLEFIVFILLEAFDF